MFKIVLKLLLLASYTLSDSEPEHVDDSEGKLQNIVSFLNIVITYQIYTAPWAVLLFLESCIIQC